MEHLIHFSQVIDDDALKVLIHKFIFTPYNFSSSSLCFRVTEWQIKPIWLRKEKVININSEIIHRFWNERLRGSWI